LFAEVVCMAEVLATYISEMRGRYPDVPLADGVDLDAIKATDPNPMFVTLPIVHEGAKSEKGFAWKAADVQRVLSEIIAKRPEGILGHVRPDERSHRYDLPAVRWVGAILDENGVVWGKALVTETRAKDYFRTAKAANARVGTSVYGVRGTKGLEDMTLESIDFGHPDRLGNPNAAAIPKITSELSEGDPPMSDNENKLVSELTTQRDAAQRLVSETEGKLADAQKIIAELKGKETELANLGEIVAEFSGATVADKIKALVAQVKAAADAERKRAVEGVVAELVKLDELRPLVIAELGSADAESAKGLITEIMARPHFKTLADKLARTAGPNVVTGETRPDVAKVTDPAYIADARSQFGF
jgi:hypothetical protein